MTLFINVNYANWFIHANMFYVYQRNHKCHRRRSHTPDRGTPPPVLKVRGHESIAYGQLIGGSIVSEIQISCRQ